MSLDTLQLNSFLTLAFYKNMLVDASNPVENPGSKIEDAIKFLGDNKKEYVFLVDDPGSIFLNPEDLRFFIQLIAACKLTLPDIALVNISNAAQKTFREITDNIPAKTLIAFGQTTSDLDLPFSIPHFQVQQYESRQYLTAPPVAKIKSHAEDKKKLWAALRRIFNLS